MRTAHPTDLSIPRRSRQSGERAAQRGAPQSIPNYFYGYCSQDCRPCYSGNPYPQCPPDIYEGSPQYCLPFQGC